MSLKLSASSFLSCVKKSGLIESHRVDALLQEFQQQGIDCSDSKAIATALIESRELTHWQAEKLLQGRHMGFILGRYKVLSLLGAGEMSSVYLAEHVMMERKCAIKVLPANKVQDTSYLERFRREALAVASMDHANIVRAYDVDKKTESGTDIYFLVMEFVEGRNLEQMVKDQGPLELVAAVDYIRQAADGLAHAHQLQMVHRDVKPGNLLVDSTGCVKVLDLGLARFFKSSHEESLTIKHDEKVLGTADYLAPEQAVDSHRVDARADIYSLGCTLYFALTGHPPFTDGTLVQRLLAHQTKNPPSVRHERKDIDDELLAILDKMMAKKCADRFQSAAELSEALARWMIKHAPAAWKRKHLSLVALLGSAEEECADQRRDEPIAAAEQRPVLSMAQPAAGNNKTASASALAVADPPSEPKPSRPEKPKERRSRPSVRLASASTETAIAREASLDRPVAVRMRTPAARARSTISPAAARPAEQSLPAPSRDTRRIMASTRKPHEHIPISSTQKVLSSAIQITPRTWVIIAMLATVLICGVVVQRILRAHTSAICDNVDAPLLP